MARFQGFPSGDGLLVLDTETGEVVFVSAEATERKVLRPASVAVVVTEPVVISPVPTLRRGPDAPAPTLRPPPSRPSRKPGAEARPSSDELDELVLRQFPAPIAAPYERMLTEEDPRNRCKLLVDTFTAVLKMWALQTASEYLAADGVRDARVNDTLGRDLQRPLISAWNLVLDRTLPVLRSAKVSAFSPELDAAYQRLEAKCRDPIDVETEYEDERGDIKTRRSKLPKIQALIKYRNSLAHGYTQTREQAAAEASRYEVVLRDILHEARFLARYPLHCALFAEDGKPTGRAFRLVGAQAAEAQATEIPPGVDPLAPFFLVDEASGRRLPLGAFFTTRGRVTRSAGRAPEPHLYEGCTKSSIVYLSTVGAHHESQATTVRFRDALQAKAVAVKLMAPGELTVEGLRTRAQSATGPEIEALLASGKLLADAYVERPSLRRRFAELEASDCNGLVLVGEGGAGKTTALAQLATTAAKGGDVVLFYRASALPDDDLLTRVLRDVGVQTPFFEQFLQEADASMRAARARLWILIDGVNEHPTDPASLVRIIDRMVDHAAASVDDPRPLSDRSAAGPESSQRSGFTWLKVVVTTRATSYERLPPDARFGRLARSRYILVEEQRGATVVRSPLVPVAPLDLDEIGQMVAAYAQVLPEAPPGKAFRPTMQVEDLDPLGSTVGMMRNPLLLRFILSAFDRRPVPSELSLDEAMQLYLNEVVLERRGRGGGFPERAAFLQGFTAALDEVGAERIARDALYDRGQLRAAMVNSQRDSAYVQLLELGVLVETWEDTTCFVRFSFDRLCEFLLATRLETHSSSSQGLLALGERAVSFDAVRGAMTVLLVRGCRAGRGRVLVEALDACDDASTSEGAAMALRRASVAALEHLARAHDPGFAPLLTQLTEYPGPSDVVMLLALFDRLFVTGITDGASLVASAALVEATTLASDELLGQATLRQAMLLQRQGDYASSLAALTEARTCFERAGLPLLALRVEVTSAAVLQMLGDLAGAEACQRTASDALYQAGLLDVAAEAKRQQAASLALLKRFQECNDVLAVALEWARSSGAAATLARCLQTSGGLALYLGDMPRARRDSQAALRIADELGLLEIAARVSGNLGVACLNAGDLDEAERLMRINIAAIARLGDLRGHADALNNLAIVQREQGQFDAAEATLRAVVDMLQRPDQRIGRLNALNSLGAVLAFRRDLPGALRCFEEVVQLGLEFQPPHAADEALWLGANTCLDLGAETEAAAWIERLERFESGASLPLHPFHVQALAMRRRVRSHEMPTIALAELDAALSPQLDGLEPDTRPTSLWIDAALLAHQSHPDIAPVMLERARRYANKKRTLRDDDLARLTALLPTLASPQAPVA